MFVMIALQTGRAHPNRYRESCLRIPRLDPKLHDPDSTTDFWTKLPGYVSPIR